MLPAEQDGQPDPEPILPGHVPTQSYGRSIRHCDDELGTQSSYKICSDNTGKEVVGVCHDGLQLDEAQFPYRYRPGSNGIGTEVVNFAPTKKGGLTCSEPPTKWRSRKRLLLASVFGLVVLITAAVVGGVLGSRQVKGSNSSNADASQSSTSTTSSATRPTGTSTVTLNFLKQKSNLCVAAWRKSHGLQIFLYYQSQNGSLRWSTYDDTQSSFTYNGSYWGKSTEVVMDSDSTDSAANDTSLAAGILLWGTAQEVSCCLGI